MNQPGPVTAVDPDRVRTLRWSANDVDLPEVVSQVRRLHTELAGRDADWDEHPHPRNCALNLVVTLGDHHRAIACDKLVAGLGPSHPLRAILLHLGGGKGPGVLDAEVTSEAHQLVRGFPVQREQVLLHVRGEAAEHLSSLVEPLLVPDVMTYLWWSGREPLGGMGLQEAIRFSDVLVVDSTHFERAAERLLEIADLMERHESPIGVTDFRWTRLRPWIDCIAQFFAPPERRALLAGVQEIDVEVAGSGPDSRIAGALLAGWMAAGLRWRFAGVRADGGDRTVGVARSEAGHEVRLTLRSAPDSRREAGDVLSVRVAASAGSRTASLSIEREPGGRHARVTIQLDGSQLLHQRLPFPRQGDPDLLVQALWSGRRDPLFERALVTSVPVLEALAA